MHLLIVIYEYKREIVTKTKAKIRNLTCGECHQLTSMWLHVGLKNGTSLSIIKGRN